MLSSPDEIVFEDTTEPLNDDGSEVKRQLRAAMPNAFESEMRGRIQPVDATLLRRGVNHVLACPLYAYRSDVPA